MPFAGAFRVLSAAAMAIVCIERTPGPDIENASVNWSNVEKGQRRRYGSASMCGRWVFVGSFGVECSVNLLEINVPRKKGNFQKPRQRCLPKFQVQAKTCCVSCALFSLT